MSQNSGASISYAPDVFEPARAPRDLAPDPLPGGAAAPRAQGLPTTVKRHRILLRAALGLPAVVGFGLFFVDGVGLLGQLLRGYAVTAALVALIWLTRLLLRRLLWRVGNRLAFSYFLIGVVPIPLVALLVGVGSYVVFGYLLGHLYRSAVDELRVDLGREARGHLDELLGRPDSRPSPLPASFAYYRDGRRFAGDSRAPDRWRAAWTEGAPEDPGAGGASAFYALEDGSTTIAAAAATGRFGVLAMLEGDPAAELSRRAGIWVELAAAEVWLQQDADRVTFRLGSREYPLEALEPRSRSSTIQSFFTPDETAPGWLDRPLLVWVEMSRPYLDAATLEPADDAMVATLASSLRALAGRLISPSAEVGAFVYVLFALVFLLTFDIYLVALVMALSMIFGLSKAVNKLYRATQSVLGGDFSTRIPITRKDQVGKLQESFNDMAANLESLVSTAAQKEIWERELSLARELQRSLLPDTLKAPPPLAFATYFRPSTALGGDYYDLLRLADGRLAVAIADVAGHGLAAGLRSAMVKSAFEILCEEESDPRRIFERLHRLLSKRLRRPDQRRAFVTATLTTIDLESSRITLTNAGHPPSYLLRGGQVEEILLPSPPLGALGTDFASTELDFLPGDVWVWLSDGVIEATDGADEPFGYERVRSCLGGLPADPARVKEALLEALAEHYGDGGRLDDDVTLVVMAHGGSDSASPEGGPSPEGGDPSADDC